MNAANSDNGGEPPHARPPHAELSDAGLPNVESPHAGPARALRGLR